MPHTARSGTLAANTVRTVNISSPGTTISVECRTPGDTIWARIDGVAPTVGGDDCFPARGVRYFDVPILSQGSGSVIAVKLIASTTADYTVEGRP